MGFFGVFFCLWYLGTLVREGKREVKERILSSFFINAQRCAWVGLREKKNKSAVCFTAQIFKCNYFKMKYLNVASVAVNKKRRSSQQDYCYCRDLWCWAHADAALKTMKIKTRKQQQSNRSRMLIRLLQSSIGSWQPDSDVQGKTFQSVHPSGLSAVQRMTSNSPQ